MMVEDETLRSFAPQQPGGSLEAKRRHLRGTDPSVGLDAADRADLEASGFPAEAFALLELIPLVEVAWADGSVSIRERDVILAAALRRGFTYGDPAYRQFVAWLAVEPPDAIFRASLRALVAALLRLPSSVQRDDCQRRLLDGCQRVAEVAGGICFVGDRVSRAERRALASIADALARAQSAETGRVTIAPGYAWIRNLSVTCEKIERKFRALVSWLSEARCSAAPKR
jgi:hypothetical protein